jgi:protoporphyrinogen oxidase
MKIGIIGAGLMGLVLGKRLAERGHQIVLFERDRQVGGLSTYHDFGAFVWDRFYHVILPTDSNLIRFVAEIGLSDALRWSPTRTGFFVDGTFHSLDDVVDFIKFRPISLWSKVRLGLTILYGSRISDWRALERVTVEQWLLRYSGRAVYEKLWKPLLLAKLGENYRRVSAVFIWSYIKRLFSARDTAAKREHMGHVAGGYKTVFDRVTELIRQKGGAVKTDVAVEAVERTKGGKALVVRHDHGSDEFDKVIVTSPANVLAQVIEPGLLEIDDRQRQVEYLGVICMVMITRKPVTPYYVLNIADPKITFTGVIGMSTVVSPDETAGRYLTYFPKYILSSDPLFARSDDDLRHEFMAGFDALYPGFDRADIESVVINRARRVQPLQVIDYSKIVPHVVTKNPNLYVLNTSQFVNNTLNNNEVVGLVDKFLAEHGAEVGA